MISRIREQLGPAGLIVAIVALVAALAGGAVAANNGGGSGDSEATASAKGKQGPRGPRGKRGPKGATGPAGPAGPAGAKGDAGAPGASGKDGAPGKDGTPGANGKSVTGEPILAGGACGAGVTGVKYTLDGTPTNVCNGKEGPEGPPGQPWVPDKTLPEEATLTGVWSFFGNGAAVQLVPFHFPIPLSSADAATIVYQFVKEGAVNANCPGTPLEPKANPGFICIYSSANALEGGVGWQTFGGRPNGLISPEFSTAVIPGEAGGVGPSGAFARYEGKPLGDNAGGSFAVTAP